MHERRLREGMTIQGAVLALAGTNAGATAAMGKLLRQGFGELIPALDEFGIYENRIHDLALLASNTDTLAALLYATAYRLGGMTPERLNTAIDTVESQQPHDINLRAVVLEAALHQVDNG